MIVPSVCRVPCGSQAGLRALASEWTLHTGPPNSAWLTVPSVSSLTTVVLHNRRVSLIRPEGLATWAQGLGIGYTHVASLLKCCIVAVDQQSELLREV